MPNKFDDLFNDFFNNRKKKSFPNVGDEISKIMKALQSSKDSDVEDGLESLTNDLGEPNKVEEYKEDGFIYRKSTWIIDGKGELVKIVVIADDGSENHTPKPSKTTKIPVNQLKEAETQLEEALKIEDFEKAIELRDKIKKIKNENSPKRKRNPKSE